VVGCLNFGDITIPAWKAADAMIIIAIFTAPAIASATTTSRLEKWRSLRGQHHYALSAGPGEAGMEVDGMRHDGGADNAHGIVTAAASWSWGTPYGMPRPPSPPGNEYLDQITKADDRDQSPDDQLDRSKTLFLEVRIP